MAMTTTPASMPTTTTMAAASTARAASEREMPASRRNAAGSSNPSATTMMTPASAALGSGAKSGVRKSSVTRTSSRTPTLASCDRTPTSAAVKLRDWLPLTGNPPVSDAPMLAAPSPMNSRLPSTRYPPRRARTWPVTPLSA